MAVVTKKAVRLEKRLILHNWVNGLLGYGSTAELLRDLRDAAEGFDSGGRSYVYHHLYARGDRVGVPPDDLERYDDNIRLHLAEINRNRAEPITLKYFQYLAALYVEVFLDRRFGRPEALLRELNAFAERQEDESIRFEEGDLDKLAFWMATGSGKTLLMHLNYRQFLRYNDEPLDNVLLITPNEGLTEQHLREMRLSGIPCERFSGARSGLGLDVPDTVRATEITKLTENKQGGGVSVDVEAFEGRNLIFVDEGHKGAVSSATKSGKSWRGLRDRLDERGFTFEYSATFGQALSKNNKEARELSEEYGRAILFDYSYRYFYDDGYGKDFQILNLKEGSEEYTDLLLLGNLLSFYQQKRCFEELDGEVKEYNLEDPLWIFVGSSVSKEKGSDVYLVARFLHRFLKNEGDWSVRGIERLLEGESGLEDGDGRDAFERRFGRLTGERAQDVYRDVLRSVFHAPAGGALRVADIKGAGGELGLKVAGADEYFGLIYIGDTPAFKKLLEAGDEGIPLEEDAIGGSLFDGINAAGSPINVLVGARKFTEGWSSWRVSNMGLLNVGQGEGPMIIQLFGRGVRLKGRSLKGGGFSLKRSSALDGRHPDGVRLLETLDIFGMRADYMSRFKEDLEREGVDPDGYEEMPRLPIRKNEEFLEAGLVIPVPPNEEFAASERVVLDVEPGLKVSLDLSARLETTRMGGEGLDTRAMRAGEERYIEPEYLSMLDWSSIHLDLLEFKNARGLWNLILPVGAPRRIMEQPEPAYSLIADRSVVEPRDFEGLRRLEGVVHTLLRKYVERFYHLYQQRWDSKHMRLEGLTGEHPNFADYAVKVKRSERDLVREVQALIDRADEVYDRDLKTLPAIHLDRHLYQPLLVDRNDDVKSTPAGLKESERNFVEALRKYLKEHLKERTDGSGREVFLLRNLSRGKGVGFFDTAGFYPDFILWIKYAGGSQKVVFVEPHGMRNDNPPPHNDKVNLYLALRDLSDRLARDDEPEVFLDSYIVSATPFGQLSEKWGGGWTRERFAGKHVLFEDDLDSGMDALLAPRDGLERRISTSYPPPLARGYRSLMDVGDPGGLYREQLRFAENVLAFLASISLALLREEDREKAGLDLAAYWRGGISPGDWKDIIRRCSKVFAGYTDIPLATAIYGLKIGSEQKGFGRDVVELIRAKNDYKHDRGPTEPEDLAEASDGTQEKLRRCMEALAFLADYPMREAEDLDPGGKPLTHGLFLNTGDGLIPLFPFITSATCLRCGEPETYFVDAWDRKKNVARLKSFERGHTTTSGVVSDALS